MLDTMDAMAGLERAFPHFTQTAIILARQDWDKHSETLKRRPWFSLEVLIMQRMHAKVEYNRFQERYLMVLSGETLDGFIGRDT